jgi:DNA-binding HxlR family transcriptional regulator
LQVATHYTDPGDGSTGQTPGMAGPPPPPDESPLRAALDRIGDRWILLVVESLADGPLRFGDLRERVGAAPNILTNRLRRLETEGLVVATPYTERPVRVQYDLTAAGRELAAALVALSGWGAAAEGRPGEHFHESCGTALELRPWCPTCDRVVGDDESRHTYDL